MDTRTLEILKNDKTTMLSLVEPGAGGEVIACIDPATVHSDPLREVRRRYNAHNAMRDALEHIQGHWTAANEEGNIAFALDIASCETCKALTAAALEQANK